LEFCPANPCQPAAASRLLSWTLLPFSTSRLVSRSRYVPPSGFGYPPDGLLLPSPCRPCFMPTALLGFALRSFPLSQGPRNVSARVNPPAVSPDGTALTGARTRPVEPRLLGFGPFRESLAGRRVISAPASRMLPWVFSLPGPFRENLERDSARSPLTRFAESLPKEKPGRRPRVSIGSRLTSVVFAGRPATTIEVTLLGFSHLSAPEHSGLRSFGLCVHLLPCRALLSTNRQSLKDPMPCRSCPGSAKVPSLRDLNVASTK